MVFQIFLFIAAVFILSWLSSRIISALVDVAKFLHWREFIIAFFVMAFAASLPNLFVDMGAALRGMPEIAFGDIVGGNLVDLTLVLAVAVFFSAKTLPAESEMVQKSAIFTSLIALLPVLLIFDGRLGRLDGFVLLGAFAVYTWWLFSKEDRFKKTYRGRPPHSHVKFFWKFVGNLFKILLLLVLLLVCSQFVVESAKMFSSRLGISLSLVGILIVGLGNCFPELYFTIISARRGENWLILGDLMGAVIVPATLVLGIIALFFPFNIPDLSPFLMARSFMILAALLFWLFIRSDRMVTKKEGLVFLSIYVLFLLSEIFIPH